MKRRPVKLTPRLRRFLLDYAYPGNIRELRNTIYRLTCLAPDVADIGHLPEDVRAAAMQPGGPASAAPVTAAGSPMAVTSPYPRQARVLPEAPGGSRTASSAGGFGNARRAASAEAERAFLEQALREVGGAVTELARRCAMNRSYVQVLLKKHGIRAKDFKTPAADRSGHAV